MDEMATTTTAVSNIIGALLLIVITIAISAVAYVVIMHDVGTATQNIQITVQSAGLLKSSDTTIFSINVQNTGTVALSGFTMTINGNTITSLDYGSSLISSSNPLPGGASTSYESSTLSGSFTIGVNYLVQITVTGKTGSTYATEENVQCMGA